MKSYKELTRRYLLNQKKRSVLALIGIVLSVALICSAGIMGESLQNMEKENIKQSYGNYHVWYSGVEESQLKLLQGNIKVDAMGSFIPAAIYRPAVGQSALIMGCDKVLAEMSYLKLSSGEFPQEDDEIAMEQWLLDNMKSKPAIGDKISIEIKVVTNQMAETEEELSNRKITKEFVLSGILKNKSSSQFGGGSMAIVTLQTAKKIMDYPNIKYMSALRFKDKVPAQKTIKEIAEILGKKGKDINENSAVLALSGQSNRSSVNNAILIVELIMVLVILVTTVAVIYNVFHISVIERIHQFGILRSVGTTPEQIRRIVLGEALILSFVGLPLGILCGIVAVEGVIGTFALMSANTLFGGLHIIISAKVLILSVILGLVTVLASAYGPAVMAGRVSPLEAILNSAKLNKDKIKKRKHPILQKIFGIEGIMAYENLKRNKKRFFITVFSMCIGIALFIFFSSFMKSMTTVSSGNFSKNYAIDKPMTADTAGYSPKDYEEVAGIKGVKTVYRTRMQNVKTLLTNEQAADSFKNFVKGKGQKLHSKYEGKDYFSFEGELYGLRESELQLCKDAVSRGSIQPEKMDLENGVLVYQKAKFDNDHDRVRVSDLKVGDEISIITKGQNKPQKMKVVGILDNMPLSTNTVWEKFKIVTTEKVWKKVTGEDQFSRFDIELEETADREAVKRQLESIQKRVPDSRLLDFTEVSDQMWEIQISVILYGLVFVISVIGALNIINTISTNLILRTREFGTLRAVGMTPGQMNKMIRLEGIFYGIIATVYGGIAGIGLARLLYSYLNKLKEFTWSFPWESLIIGGLGAMLIGLLATAIPLRRISRMDVVEAVRAEE
ncbi:MAG: ABC transporter permease [Clostridia bacterium]|nr:ABC transporter permease [Clostridia bacterium]